MKKIQNETYHTKFSMKNPPIVFCDADGPIADFDLALKKSGLYADEFKMLPGTYLWLQETTGARAALEKLKELEDHGVIKVFIATKTPSGSPYAHSEKVLWFREHFPWLENRVILIHDKSLLGTEQDFLTDDRHHKGNVKNFRGTLHWFDVAAPVESWKTFLHMVTVAAEKQV